MPATNLPMNIKSDVKPHISNNNKILICSGRNLSLHQLSVNKNSVSLKLIDELTLNGQLQAFSINGDIVSIAIALTELRCTIQYT